MSFYDLDPVSDTYRDAGMRVEIALEKENLREILRYFVAAVNEGGVRAVLDVGCGAGAITNFVRRELGRKRIAFVGVDLSPTQIANARKDLGKFKSMSFAVCSGERLPFADGAFDIVYETSALTWSRSPRAFIEEMIRVSRHLVAFHVGVTPRGGESHACAFGWVRQHGSDLVPQFRPADYGIAEIVPVHLVPSGEKGLFQYPVSTQKTAYLSEPDYAAVVNGGGVEILFRKTEAGSRMTVKRGDEHDGPPNARDQLIQERYSSRYIVARKV